MYHECCNSHCNSANCIMNVVIAIVILLLVLGAGKTKKRKRNSDDLEWIDRLEELGAIFDDD